MPMETPLKHLTLLPLVFFDNTRLILLFAGSSSNLSPSISSSYNLSLVGLKDIIPLIYSPILILKSLILS